MTEMAREGASFRDPSGHVFTDGTVVKRVINPIYFSQFESLTQSGFYDNLFKKDYLIRHREISRSAEHIIIEPAYIPFISYPYEWSFMQYKHAALLTLQIQIECLNHNYTLKDASAFNITFHNGKPVFIDTLSFEIYKPDSPWTAYRQFITHFFGPLLMARYYGLDYLKHLSHNLEGIGLSELSKLLPATTYLNPTILTNIHLLARFDRKHASSNDSKASLTKASQLNLLQSLYSFIKNLKIRQATEWDQYYNQTNYSAGANDIKKGMTREWFKSISGNSLIDIGGNDGTFSREIKDLAKLLIVADIDANSVEQNYRKTLQNKEVNIVPIVADFLNPAAALGFNNEERSALIDRIVKLDLSGCLALAVIHHISLSGNIPFSLSAKFFARLAPNLLIEFPTRDDSWVKFLLDSKREARNLFDFYNEDAFEKEYCRYFDLVQKRQIDGSARIMFQFKRRDPVTI